MGIVVRNWRDQGPYVGHINALVWTLFRGKETEDSPETALLHGMNVFVKHGLQGRQHSDHHHHTDIEQMYFVLRGRGQLLIGDDKVDVQEGTAVYMPVNVPHQAFNDGDYWMEHLIVSCPLDEIREGTPAVRDWRDVTPVIEEHKAIAWPLLTREGEATTTDGGVLQRMHSVTRYAVQGRQTTDWQVGEDLEMVYFILSGHGAIESEDKQEILTEGTAAYVPPNTFHRFINQSEGWLEYVAFAVEVTVEEDEEQESVVDEEIDLDVVVDGNDQIDDDEEDEQVVENEDDIGNEDGDGEPVDGDGDGEAKIEETDSEPSQDSNRADEDGEVESNKPNLQ